MLQVRRGEMKFRRLGAVNAVRQRSGSRAPARHGVWAFPWPLFDMYYAVHKFETVLPKRLRMRTGFDEVIVPAEDQLPQTDEDWAAFWQGRDAWMREHGLQVLPIRDFWWSGPVYAHLNRSGEYVGMGEWELLSVREFEVAVRRHIAGLGRHRSFRARSYELGVFEVFIPMRRGGRDHRPR
jgi:hypothetical protein